MKKTVTIIIDFIVVYGSIILGFQILQGSLINYRENIQAFEVISPMICLLYLVLMYTFGLYNYTRRKLQDILYTVSLVSVSLTLGIMAICFFVRGGALAFPRSVILLSALFYWIFLTIWRTLLWSIARNNHGVKKVMIVGTETVELADTLKNKYKDIYSVQYVCDENDEYLQDKLQKSELVFISLGVSSYGREKILLFAIDHEIEIYFIPEYKDINIMSSLMQKVDDIPTFLISKMELTMEERFVKRLIDLSLGIIGGVIVLPMGLITAVLIKLDGGPVFYSQERFTRNGKIFRVLKFRSMVPNAEKLSGPVLASENDPRITLIGRFMRATRLDEVPQILNVINGDMSIVGPRPERPFFTEQFEKEIPEYRQRLKVKAGLTGLAQVEGKYNTSVKNKLRYDLLYINNYSLFQDILIIFQTIKILFTKESTEGVIDKKS